MKALQLINNLEREGAQVVVYNLVACSSPDDVEHLVFARQAGGGIQAALEEKGVKVLSPKRYFRAREIHQTLASINDIIREHDIDLVHAHLADAAILGWLVARKNNIPLLLTHHGADILPRCGYFCRLVHHGLLFFAARYAQYNIVVSQAVEDTLYQKLRLAPKCIQLLPNGVPIPPKNDMAVKNEAEPDGIAAKRFTIVTVGRLVDIKGYDQLVTAVELLSSRLPELSVVMVGDGPLRKELEHQVKERKLEHQFRFAGSVDDVSQYLRKADLFVSTSHVEGMPMSVLEAMAWQVPVLASDIAGNRSVVKQGETGILYPAGNVEALSASIMDIHNNKVTAGKRAAIARVMVEQKHSAVAVSKSYTQIYRDILLRAETTGNPG